MNCYNHPDHAAVGCCKVCMKGLCPACAADLGLSIACKDKHEAVAKEVDALVTRSVKVQKVAAKSQYLAPAFLAAMGVFFIVDGLRSREGITSFGTLMGAALFVFATFMLVANVRAYGPSEPDQD